MEPNYKEALRIVAQTLAWHCFGECRSFGEDVPYLNLLKQIPMRSLFWIWGQRHNK